MSHPAPYPIGLADEITRQLHLLAEHVAVLPPHQATQVIAHVLNPDDGLLDSVTGLVSVSSTFAKAQAERGVLAAEVWLALGRAGPPTILTPSAETWTSTAPPFGVSALNLLPARQSLRPPRRSSYGGADEEEAAARLGDR